MGHTCNSNAATEALDWQEFGAILGYAVSSRSIGAIGCNLVSNIQKHSPKLFLVGE